MTKEELSKELSVAFTKKRAIELAIIAAKDPAAVDLLIDLSFHKNQTYAFRASWILDSVFEICPESLEKHAKAFIGSYPKQNNPSCQRHYTRIMMSLSSKPGFLDALPADQIEQIIESSFDWLTREACPVAVQVNCMDVLYNLKGFDPWVAQELEAEIRFLMQNGTAALQSRGKKLLKKLK
ncbi:hypothetical protein [Desertivirga xinjiangensis]|uniref:hypothetical protein n=1 Tax=Desertivirga xinjiangensis TaxID=539206 RepID=UPI002108C1EB|nr:hypothetical protein [Pedobacter xinjiangensis]